MSTESETSDIAILGRDLALMREPAPRLTLLISAHSGAESNSVGKGTIADPRFMVEEEYANGI